MTLWRTVETLLNVVLTIAPLFIVEFSFDVLVNWSLLAVTYSHRVAKPGQTTHPLGFIMCWMDISSLCNLTIEGSGIERGLPGANALQANCGAHQYRCFPLQALQRLLMTESALMPSLPTNCEAMGDQGAFPPTTEENHFCSAGTGHTLFLRPKPPYENIVVLSSGSTRLFPRLRQNVQPQRNIRNCPSEYAPR